MGETTAVTMMDSVTTGVTSVIGWVGDVVTALTSGELSALLPLFGVGIAVSAVLLGVKMIKGLVWGA